MKLDELSNEQLASKIIYIDEISLFLEGLTNNETLTPNIKAIYSLLKRIVKHALKVVVSQAEITPNVWEFLKCRNDEPFTVTSAMSIFE